MKKRDKSLGTTRLPIQAAGIVRSKGQKNQYCHNGKIAPSMPFWMILEGLDLLLSSDTAY